MTNPDKKSRAPRGKYAKNRTESVLRPTARGVKFSPAAFNAAVRYANAHGCSFNQAVNEGMLWFGRVEAAKRHAPTVAPSKIPTIDAVAQLVIDDARRWNRKLDLENGQDRSWVYGRAHGTHGLPKDADKQALISTLRTRLRAPQPNTGGSTAA